MQLCIWHTSWRDYQHTCLQHCVTTLAQCRPSRSQGNRQPSYTGVAAASGDAGAGALLAREAAAHGMTLAQYAAYQEELILQQVLQVSAWHRLGLWEPFVIGYGLRSVS